jgi:hypothetical protein
MKYELTNDTKLVGSVTLHRIRRLSDGELGGYVASKANLSQFGDAWVYGNAKVSGNAWVYGNAKVSGNAWVYGNAKVSGDAVAKEFHPLVCQLTRNTITVTDKHIQIGCELHLFDHWLRNIEQIGQDNLYSKADIKLYTAVVTAIINSRRNKDVK